MAPATPGPNLISGRHLARETLHHNIGAETFQKVTDKADILLKGERLPANTPAIIPPHLRATQQLQLMQLKTRDRKPGKNLGLGNHILTALARQPQNKVPPTRNATLRRSPDRRNRSGKIVSPPNTGKSGIIATLNAILQHHIMPAPKSGNIIQPLTIHTVRTRAYHKTFNLRMREGFGVFFF